jgi:hypothetical protein
MAQFNVQNQFSFYPSVTQPVGPVLLANANRKFLQIVNNGSSGNIRFKFDTNFNVPASEVETLTLNGTPNSGTFTVQDWLGNTTAALAWNASAATVQTALNALPAIAASYGNPQTPGSVTVSGGSGASPYVVTFGGGLAYTAIPAPKLQVVSLLQNTTAQQSAIQLISWSAAPTAGQYKLQNSLGNQTTTLNWNDNGATVAAALNALPAINGGVASVTVGASSISITFGAPLANQPLATVLVAANTLTNNGVLTSNVQSLYFEPLPAQGTFELMFGGQTTAPLQYNATAGQIQTVFQALSSVGAGNCIVSGSMATGFSFAFTGALANAPQPTIQVLDGPPSQWGAVNGGTSRLQSIADPTNDTQKFIPNDIVSRVLQAIPGVGPALVTPAYTNSQVGIAPLNTTAAWATTTPGVTQAMDGVTVQAGQEKLYDAMTPLGALYVISDTANEPVQILEG